tara:strand:- start:202 stop:408 length:207 start_codon:yes stop_codon:yes gene_type:complete
MKGRCKCFLRSTSNIDIKTGQNQIGLPPKVWKKMGWKINENLIIDTVKTGMEQGLYITKNWIKEKDGT